MGARAIRLDALPIFELLLGARCCAAFSAFCTEQHGSNDGELCTGMQGTFTYLQHTQEMLPSMDKLAALLAACSFIPPARILLQDGRKLDLYLEAVPSSDGQPARLEGSAFLRTVPEADELKVQASVSGSLHQPPAEVEAFSCHA